MPCRIRFRPAVPRAVLAPLAAFVLALGVAMTTASGVAQGGACSSPEAGQFDFWLGN